MASRDARILHPDLAPAERGRLFHLGIELFNRGRHFAAHEAWEEIWRSTSPEPRDLFQGLVQVAAGLYHHEARGRREVALRVLGKARRRLTGLGPVECGLDLAALLADLAVWEEWLAIGDGDPPPQPRVRVVEPSDVR